MTSTWLSRTSPAKSASSPWPDGAVLNDWTQWKIPLSQFAGVDLSAVSKMFLGVGSRTNPQPDGTGIVYFDDIIVIGPTE